MFTGFKLLGQLFIRNVTKKLDQIGGKFCKFRSCSLGQRGLSASLLDLHEKTLDRVNENIDEIVVMGLMFILRLLQRLVMPIKSNRRVVMDKPIRTDAS